MRWTIARKLFLALVSTSVVTLVLSAVLGMWNFQRDFLDYKTKQDIAMLDEIAQGVTQHFRQYGNWTRLRDNPMQWRQLVKQNSLPAAGFSQHSRPPPPGPDRRRGADSQPGKDRPHDSPRGMPGAPPPPGTSPQSGPQTGPHSNDPLDIIGRLALYDDTGAHMAGAVIGHKTGEALPILIDNQPVGSLRLAPAQALTQEIDLRFAQGQSRSLIWIGLVVLLCATAVALLLSRQMTQPIKLLVDRARAMTRGNYEDRVALAGNSELSDLAQDFNKLAKTLDSNRQSRRQWISDISHELRTPLAILTAELQALEDGIREYNDGTRASLQLEVHRLNRLVHDLYELSASDEGTLSVALSSVDLAAILDEVLQAARQRIEDHSINLEILPLPSQAGSLIVLADSARLTQLFTNLIENSLRYTDTPGVLRVQCSKVGNFAEVVFEDSPPGVPDHQLAKIFDRLYRAEPSRGRHSGGSGLGLSICKAIVEAHGGSLSAAPSALGGLLIRASFPLAPDTVHEAQRA